MLGEGGKKRSAALEGGGGITTKKRERSTYLIVKIGKNHKAIKRSAVVRGG